MQHMFFNKTQTFILPSLIWRILMSWETVIGLETHVQLSTKKQSYFQEPPLPLEPAQIQM